MRKRKTPLKVRIEYVEMREERRKELVDFLAEMVVKYAMKKKAKKQVGEQNEA